MEVITKKAKLRAISYFYLLINTACWGALLPIAKWGLQDTSPFRYLFYRFLLASLLSIPLLWHYFPRVKRPFAAIKTIVSLELIGTSLALSVLYVGLQYTTSIEANLIGTTAPILLTLGGVYFLKEKEEKRELWGLFLAIIGTLLLVVSPLLAMFTPSMGGLLRGNVLILVHTLATVIYFLKAKSAFKGIPKLFVSSISFFVGLITFLILSLVESSFSLSSLYSVMIQDFTSLRVIIVVAFAAVFGSIIGLTAYIKGQAGIEASEAGLFTYLQPVISIPLAVVLLGESIGGFEIVAMLLILFGVYIAEHRRA